MKLFSLTLLLCLSFNAMAKDLYTECRFQYKTSENSTTTPVWFHNAGDFSVKDCIDAAAEARKVSITNISFKYSVFSKVTFDERGALNTDIGSEGWSLSGEIKENGTLPATLKFAEFINP
jgi:hypothetical protein